MAAASARLLLGFGLAALAFSQSSDPHLEFLNEGRPVLDAHNCYPYEGQWSDRLDRALKSGYPIGIEQDMAWYVDPQTGAGRAVISHSNRPKGTEPTLQQYFFDRVSPIIEAELKNPKPARWPLVVLHFDFKDNSIPLLRAVWNLLGEYEARGWLSTAVKGNDPSQLSPIDRKPILVLTEENDAQEQVFFSELPVGGKLRLFGSAKTMPVAGSTTAEKIHAAVATPPAQLFPGKPSNYRRWWNGSWYAVEEGGAPGAGDWTPNDAARLKSLVDYAHSQGYWIRFYTLDGFVPADDKGWGKPYNFGTPQAAQIRWAAAMQAGVNLIATDQYEAFAEFRDHPSPTGGKP